MVILDQAAIEKIIQAVNSRGAPRPCPLCQKHGTWTFVDGYIVLSVKGSYIAPNLVLDLPCVAMSCQNCGNTQLINLSVLGLGHLARGGQ